MTDVFACYNLNEIIRMQSSSGGVYYLIAEQIIAMDGVVYGACYEGTDVVHKRIKRVEDILASCGSKYQPSNLGDIFKQIKSDLKDGKKVLFTGTPCQCNGLLSFAGENENLYVVDFICYGIPSKKAWRAYLSSMTNRGMEIKSVNMRDKSYGWREYSWRLTGTDGKEIVQPHGQNLFMKGFMAALYLRPSCYECNFKGVERRTDCTLGDYWGVHKIQPELFDNKGTSLVFVHTNKGMELFWKVSNQLKYTKVNLESVLEANPSINHTVQKPLKRKEFFDGVKQKKDFLQMVEKLTEPPLYKQIEGKTKAMLKRILGKVR